MAKAPRPRIRVNDHVTLASHTPLIPAYGGKPFVGRDTILRVSSIQGKGTLRDPWGVNITDDAGHFWHMQPDDIVLVEVHAPEPHHATKKKSSSQLQREIDRALAKDFTASNHPSGVEWGDLAPTGIRVQTHSGDAPLEEATAVEIRRDMNRRLTGYRALAHVPGRRKKWALAVYELAQAKPWIMDQVPHDVWGLVLADIGRSEKRSHAVKKRVLEKGQRVVVLDSRGQALGRGHVYSGDNYPAPNEHTTWVKMSRHGETTTQEWPTDRVQPSHKHG